MEWMSVEWMSGVCGGTHGTTNDNNGASTLSSASVVLSKFHSVASLLSSIVLTDVTIIYQYHLIIPGCIESTTMDIHERGINTGRLAVAWLVWQLAALWREIQKRKCPVLELYQLQ